MEINIFAKRILESRHLEDKLVSPPDGMTDDNPRPPKRIMSPIRPPNLPILPGREVTVPPIDSMHDKQQCARIVHALANHELQAAELFAWALLAFPEYQSEFRRGLLSVLKDEQRHTKMYIARLRELDANLGDFPVSGFFWNKIQFISTPLQFICAMSLTFESIQVG